MRYLNKLPYNITLFDALLTPWTTANIKASIVLLGSLIYTHTTPTTCTSPYRVVPPPGSRLAPRRTKDHPRTSGYTRATADPTRIDRPTENLAESAAAWVDVRQIAGASEGRGGDTRARAPHLCGPPTPPRSKLPLTPAIGMRCIRAVAAAALISCRITRGSVVWVFVEGTFIITGC